MEITPQPNQESMPNSNDSLETKRQEVAKLHAEYLATQELVAEKQKKLNELRESAEKHETSIEALAERRDNLNATIRDQRKKEEEAKIYLNYITAQLTKNKNTVTEVRKEVTKARRLADPVFSARQFAHDEFLKTERMFKEISQKLREAQLEYQLKGGEVPLQEIVILPSTPENQSGTQVETHNNPWVSGSFYVFAIVVIMTLLAVISSSLPWYSVGIVFVGGLLAVSIIGALQLRNDKKLSEANFIKLMIEAIKQLPSLLNSPKEKSES
jgi:hypothetical protein